MLGTVRARAALRAHSDVGRTAGAADANGRLCQHCHSCTLARACVLYRTVPCAVRCRRACMRVCLYHSHTTHTHTHTHTHTLHTHTHTYTHMHMRACSFAGRLTDALFDKTGTITTDQLQVVGVASYGVDDDIDASCVASPERDAWRDATHGATLRRADEARVRARVVLAACHALVAVRDSLVGDPTELAAFNATRWRYDAARHLATPVPLAVPPTVTATPARSTPAVANADAAVVRAVYVLHTYHFASRCVACVAACVVL